MSVFKLPVMYAELTPYQRKLVRLQYIKEQGNLCKHCNGSLDLPSTVVLPIAHTLFPLGFFKNPIHLHHCHKTGLTIGAVHAVCNAACWQYLGE